MTQIPTTRGGSSGGDAARSTTSRRAEPVALSALHARQITLEWFEAIAIVQAARESAEENGDDLAKRSLAPDDVTIYADGRVAANRKSSGNESDWHPVHTVARLLRDLLPETFPMPLRLAITQALSSPPFYASLKDFSEALSYFERPNRAGIIQTVYQRLKDSSVKVSAITAPPLPAPTTFASPKTRRPLPIRRFVHLALMVLAAAAVSILVVHLFDAGKIRPGAAAQIVERTTAVVDSMLDHVLPLPAATEAGESESSAATPVTTASRRTAPPPASTNQFVAAQDPPVLAAPIAAFDLSMPPAALPAALVPDGAKAGPATTIVGQQAGPQIYSDGDSGVSPPVATYPRLPSTLPPETLPEDLAVMDLVIDDSGRVELVRLRSDPTTMGDAMVVTMNLSAAKTWRFQPAMKDGSPVRYRKSIWFLTH